MKMTSATVAEIHKRFWRKMAPSGRIDQILAGDSGPSKKTHQRASDEEIEHIKKSIDVQLDEYEAAIIAFRDWQARRKARQPKGFRSTRRKAAG